MTFTLCLIFVLADLPDSYLVHFLKIWEHADKHDEIVRDFCLVLMAITNINIWNGRAIIKRNLPRLEAVLGLESEKLVQLYRGYTRMNIKRNEIFMIEYEDSYSYDEMLRKLRMPDDTNAHVQGLLYWKATHLFYENELVEAQNIFKNLYNSYEKIKGLTIEEVILTVIFLKVIAAMLNISSEKSHWHKELKKLLSEVTFYF